MSLLSATILLALLYISSCSCSTEKTGDHDGYVYGYIAEVQKWIDPYSFFYDKGTKQMLPMESTELAAEITRSERIPCEQYHAQEYIFYKRLIKLLLANAFLEVHEPYMNGTILIEATPSDLQILHSFNEGKVSIREADRILFSIIKEPRPNMIVTFYYNFTHLLKLIRENIQVISVLLCCIISYMWLRNITWSPTLIIFAILMVIFIISFFITWYKLIQEAHIKLKVVQHQFADVPDSCQPDKMSLWRKFMTCFFSSADNSCEKYYEGMISNSLLEVTPAVVLSHLLCTVFMHPLPILGNALRGFITGLTAELPVVLNFFIVFLLNICVGILIIAIPICLLGGCLMLGFFKLSGSFSLRRSAAKLSEQLIGRTNLTRIEDIDESSGNDKAILGRLTKDPPEKKSPNAAVEKNNYEKSGICRNVDCCMANGVKKRKEESTDSEKKKDEACKYCGSNKEKMELGQGDCQ